MLSLNSFKPLNRATVSHMFANTSITTIKTFLLMLYPLYQFILLINFNFDKYTKIKECALDRLLRPFRLLCLIQKKQLFFNKIKLFEKEIWIWNINM